VSIFSEKKKLKKALQLKKNRFQQEIFNLLRLRRQEEERVKKQQEEKNKPQELEKGEDDGEMRDKMAVIRNRLTDKKRTSRERWNRFAGTSGGGGRGL